jgi:hypothetical protein
MQYALFQLAPVLDKREVGPSCNENVENMKAALEAMNTNINNTNFCV